MAEDNKNLNVEELNGVAGGVHTIFQGIENGKIKFMCQDCGHPFFC